jgi:hypothetical protein
VIADAVAEFLRALGPWHTRAPVSLKKWERARRRRWADAYFAEPHQNFDRYPMLRGGHGYVWCGEEDGDASVMFTVDGGCRTMK